MSITDKVVKASPKKWVMGCGVLVLLGIGCLVFAVLQVVDYPIVAMRAADVESKYRAAGLPWVQSELEAPFVGKKTIGDELKSQLADRDGFWPGAEKNLKKLLDAGDIAGVQLLTDGLASPSLDEFQAIADAEVFFVDYDWDLGASVLFPEFGAVKTGAKMLAARAEVRARGGDLDGALEDLRAGYLIGNKVGRTPSLIGMLVGIACRSIILNGVLMVADAGRDDTAWLARCRAEVARWSPEADLEWAMRGDAYMGIAIIRNLPSGSAGTRDPEKMIQFVSPDNLVREGMPQDSVHRAFMVRHLEMQLELSKMSEEFGGDARKIAQAWDRLEERTNGRGVKLSLVLNAILMPVISQAGNAIVMDEFRRDAALAILWAQEMKATTGSYPKDLSAYPGGLTDLFTGEAARFQVIDNRVEVFSLGPDEILDGENGTNRERDDFGWAFPMVERTVIYSRD